MDWGQAPTGRQTVGQMDRGHRARADLADGWTDGCWNPDRLAEWLVMQMRGLQARIGWNSGWVGGYTDRQVETQWKSMENRWGDGLLAQRRWAVAKIDRIR